MKQTIAAAAFFSSLTAAIPQWGGPHGNGGNWGNDGPFASFPSCVSGCRPDNTDWNSADSLCDNNDTLINLNSCVDGSSCSESDKSSVKQAVAQLCANAGTTVTAAPFATYSVTSGESPSGTPPAAVKGGGPWRGWGQWASDHSITGWPTSTAASSSWASANGLPTASADWPSWASSQGWWGGKGDSWPTSAYSDFASWISAAGLTARPTDTAQWHSITSAHPLPSDLSSAAGWWRANDFPGGSAWPSDWTTNSAWASAVSNWGGRGGWHGGTSGYGPFGQGGPGGRGWGNGPWASDGSWTSGAWTKWWGTDACPASTWSGWTDASWATSAPWTTWAGCTASTTASSVVTVTTTASDGNTVTALSTSLGIRVAQVTNAVVTTDGNGAPVTPSNSDSGALPTDFAFAGSAAGMIGVLAGAILL